MSETILIPHEEETEIGTLDTLPSPISFCFENNKRLDSGDVNYYGDEITLKVGDIAFVKDAP